MDRLFDLNNVNHEIMCVEQQEGGDVDDHYFGSIGDATMTHVQGLSDFERQMWEELILMPSGAMFQMVPSTEDNDKDPLNLRGQDLEEYIQKFEGKCNEAQYAALKEAIQVEEEHRAEVAASEDALDADCLSYEEWEQFPGHWSKMDIPTTPKDRAVFIGETTQQFMDEFPVGHPDANKIDQFLKMINRKWEDNFDEGFRDWACNFLDTMEMKEYTKNYLTVLVYKIEQDNYAANEYVREALLGIDNEWHAEYKDAAFKKTFDQPMIRMLQKKEEEWDKAFKTGYNVQSAIRQFGQLLFLEFREQMAGKNYNFWEYYRRAKLKYSPQVILKGVDLNRCSLHDLKKVLRISHKVAQDVWYARPFATLEHAYNTGRITATSFANDENTDKIVMFMEKHGNLALEEKSVKRINEVCKILLGMQQAKKGDLTSDQWSAIWRYYKILKNDLLEACKE